jgi:uncharacterized protein
LVEKETKKFCEVNNIADDHGWRHYQLVKTNLIKAVNIYHFISHKDKLCYTLAALLHDVDDRKIFPNSINYQNARMILLNAGLRRPLIDRIVYLIDLVSASKNGNSIPENKYDLLPREADRVEAIGEIGLVRCYIYTVDQDRQLRLLLVMKN